MDLCEELTNGRRDLGLSQNGLAQKLGVPRLRITRMEAGVGSVDLLVRMMPAISLRLTGIAKGDTIITQLKNARMRRRWSVEKCAGRANIDVRTMSAVEAGSGTLASLIAILNAVAPSARRQPATRAFWDYDRSKSAEADSRFTPRAFLDDVTSCFGDIHLDPCCHPKAPIEAKRKIILPEDGLKANWSCDGLVWINPPFSDLAPWLDRANEVWRSGVVPKMIFLLPASRLDLKSYFEGAACVATTLILRERLRFASDEHPNGKHRAPFALALLLWGCGEDEIESYQRKVSCLKMHPQVPLS